MIQLRPIWRSRIRLPVGVIDGGSIIRSRREGKRRSTAATAFYCRKRWRAVFPGGTLTETIAGGAIVGGVLLSNTDAILNIHDPDKPSPSTP